MMELVSPFSLEGDGGGYPIFQESECWCPLKEDDKVDDGFGKLAFWKPKSNLTQAQNELSVFTLIFFIILFVNMRYAPLYFII